MGTLAKKRELLEKAQYAFDFRREVYFNRETKTAFSVEFIEDHDAEQLERCIGENSEREEWRFYFNSSPSESVKRELESVLA